MFSHTDSVQSRHHSSISELREGKKEENLSQASMQLCDRQPAHSKNSSTKPHDFEEWEEDFFFKKSSRNLHRVDASS